jgi:hypothetical protein
MAITLATTAGFTAALARARTVTLASYTLHPGAVLGALDAAARRGARVNVRLDGDPLDAAGKLQRDNAAAVAELRAAGADAAESAAGGPELHMKAAVVDGVAWLDDRNWAGVAGEQIVRDDDPADVAAIAAALAGRPASAGSNVGTTKQDALGLEAGLIAGAGAAPLAVETESFGNGPIYNALLRRAQAHEPTRLLVAGRELAEARSAVERAHLARLATLGVEVRAGNPRHDTNGKLAVTAGAAWTGSANATYARDAFGAQRDWGVLIRDAPVVAGLGDTFERDWSLARPIEAAALVPERQLGRVALTRLF